MKDSFQPVVGAKFLVDGVEMVPQCRQRYIQLFSNLIRVFRFGEELEDPLLLIGQGFDRGRLRLAFPN